MAKFLIFAILIQIFNGKYSYLLNLPIPTINETLQSTLNKTASVAETLPVPTINETLQSTLNKTASVAEALPFFNETSLANFTYTINSFSDGLQNTSSLSYQVDCLGLGETVAKTLKFFFQDKANGSNALDVQFFLSSRNQSRRVQVVLGEQFGLEWTDFKMERRTVVIVHGFLSHGQETWIRNMEQAFLDWDDVNVVVVDWSDGSNTWNYFKAAVNTEIVGYQISKLIEHLTNATIDKEPDTSKWGPLHLIGHSLGAHICGFAAKNLKKMHNSWTVQRITGLDPAQPCFRNIDSSFHLDKDDAPFVDVIHTNGKFLMHLGLGLPNAIGNADFYPNGGKVQPGCVDTESSIFSFLEILHIPKTVINEAICSHGRSYVYFTESLVSAVAKNCSFWAHHSNVTYKDFLRVISEPCDRNICTEMGIRAETYDDRGTFFVTTSNSAPFCDHNSNIVAEIKEQLNQDYQYEIKDLSDNHS